MPDFEQDIQQCLTALNNGGVILYPTDTVWGLGCDATNSKAVQKLTGLKQKPGGKGLIVLLSTERDVLRYAASPDLAVFDYLAQTTQPTTVIYEHGLEVADEVLNDDGSIAIRLVNEDFCRHLLKRFKKPIVSTSANVHGQPSPQNFEGISRQVKDAVDYIVQYRQEEKKNGKSSSIIKWENGEANVMRL